MVEGTERKEDVTRGLISSFFSVFGYSNFLVNVLFKLFPGKEQKLEVEKEKIFWKKLLMSIFQEMRKLRELRGCCRIMES